MAQQRTLFKNNKFDLLEFDDTSFGISGTLNVDTIHPDDVVKITFSNGKSILVPIDIVWIGYKRFQGPGQGQGQGNWKPVRSAGAGQPVCLGLRRGYLRQAGDDIEPNQIKQITPANINLLKAIFRVLQSQQQRTNNLVDY